MDFLRFLTKYIFYKHLGIIIIIALIIVIVVLKSLDFYTHHGQYISVPDFTGLSMDELEKYTKDRNFRFEVIDSVFDDTHEKGTVIAQDPLPGSKVKPNRKIYFTLVATMPEQVAMPNLKDLTLRQARAVLETYGLKIDSLEYRPDIARNAVLEQKYEGEIIEEGRLIKKGEKINLVLGQGIGFEKIHVPYLLGKKQEEVKRTLHAASLNIGTEFFLDGDDTAHARVYQQKPVHAQNSYLNLGQAVDVWYRSDEKFNFEELINNTPIDSIQNDTIRE